MFELDKKTILIMGLVLIIILSLILGRASIGEGFKDIALTGVGGLIGYLSKDNITNKNYHINDDIENEE